MTTKLSFFSVLLLGLALGFYIFGLLSFQQASKNEPSAEMKSTLLELGGYWAQVNPMIEEVSETDTKAFRQVLQRLYKALLADGQKERAAHCVRLDIITELFRPGCEAVRVDSIITALPQHLERFYPELKSYEPILDAFFRIYYYLYKNEQIDSAYFYSEKLYALPKSDKDWEWQAEATWQLANLEINNDIKKAQSYIEELDALLEKKLPKSLKENPYHIIDLSTNNAMYWIGEGAILYDYIGDYELSLAYTRKSIDWLSASEQPDSTELAIAYYSLASTYKLKGDYDKSIEYYEQSLLFLPYNLYYAYADTYRSLADTYFRRGDYKKSLALNQLAWTNNEKEREDANYKNWRFLDIASKELQTYIALRDTGKARETLEKARAYAEARPAFFQKSEIFLADFLGDYERVIPYCEQEIKRMQKVYGEHSVMGVDLQKKLAKIAYKQGRVSDALALCDAAIHRSSVRKIDGLPELEDMIDKALTASVLGVKLAILLAEAETDKETLFALSQRHIETLKYQFDYLERKGSKAELLDDIHKSYQYLLEICWRAYQENQDSAKLEEAFLLADKAKSILLEQEQEGKSIKRMAKIDAELLEKERSARVDIGFYEQELIQAKMKKDDEKEKLAQRQLIRARRLLDSLEQLYLQDYPLYKELGKEKKKQLSIADIRQDMQPDEALLSYFDATNALYIFYLDKTGLRVERKEQTAEERGKLFTEWKKLLLSSQSSEAQTKTFFALNTELSACYLPFALPKQLRSLQILPDGLAHYIPFDLLFDKAARSQLQSDTLSYANAPYLLKQTAIQYHYSLGLRKSLSLSKETSGGQGLLAFAAEYPETQGRKAESENALLLRNTLSPLPGAEKEVAWLKEHYRGNFYVGKEANEARFRELAPKASIIHLAMHGLVHSSFPNLSSLAFSEKEGNGQDDFLHAYEIENLNLDKTELVVLSACETAHGKYKRGEGVLSLGRSFLSAGASSLLLTLWTINDQSTNYLIRLFYRHIEAGLTKSEALRQAKLDYLATVDAPALLPVFWAAFVHIGNNETLVLTRAGAGSLLWLWLLLGALVSASVLFYVLRARA